MSQIEPLTDPKPMPSDAYPDPGLPPVGEWPGEERRNPTVSDADFMGSHNLSRAVQWMAANEMPDVGGRGLDVIDVGCGEKPFYPYFRPLCRSYVGCDVYDPAGVVDRVCPLEDLMAPDQSADVVLCMSVLEHVNDPDVCVREMLRVVRPGGVVLAMTHGTFPWHPYPQDHHRWTQTGLPLLFQRNGFRDVKLYASRGTVSGCFTPLGHYVQRKLGASQSFKWLKKPAVWSMNKTAMFLDRRTKSLCDPNEHVTSIPDLFIVARPGTGEGEIPVAAMFPPRWDR